MAPGAASAQRKGAKEKSGTQMPTNSPTPLTPGSKKSTMFCVDLGDVSTAGNEANAVRKDQTAGTSQNHVTTQSRDQQNGAMSDVQFQTLLAAMGTLNDRVSKMEDKRKKRPRVHEMSSDEEQDTPEASDDDEYEEDARDGSLTDDDDSGDPMDRLGECSIHMLISCHLLSHHYYVNMKAMSKC